jgi:hypothetical protein
MPLGSSKALLHYPNTCFTVLPLPQMFTRKYVRIVDITYLETMNDYLVCMVIVYLTKVLFA